MGTRYEAKRLRPVYISDLLNELGVKQAELARRMDTDKANVTRWLSEPQRINLDVISGIADALGLADAGDLFRHPTLVTRLREAGEAAHQLWKTIESPDIPMPSAQERRRQRSRSPQQRRTQGSRNPRP